MKQTGKSMYPWNKQLDAHENWRTYQFQSGNSLTIKKPKYLVVSDNGHRIVDENNLSYYIAYTWDYFIFENEDKDKYQWYYQRPEVD